MVNLEKKLLESQHKAKFLLKEIEEREILTIGRTEQEISDKIQDLAFELFGVKKHWHKRIARTGVNSALSFKANPSDRILAENDLVYLDLGPVFDEFEADIGKTYLLGDDPTKKKLIEDLEKIWREAKIYYLNSPSMTGAELWYYVQELADKTQWHYGSHIAGHIISEFSHIQRYGDLPEHRINQLNNVSMDTPGKDGTKRYWILEIHIVHPKLEYGGFYEDLLSL